MLSRRKMKVLSRDGDGVWVQGGHIHKAHFVMGQELLSQSPWLASRQSPRELTFKLPTQSWKKLSYSIA